MDDEIYIAYDKFKEFYWFQNLGEIPNLQGLEEDQSLEEEMNLRILGYKAFR